MNEPQDKSGILAEHYSETYTYLQVAVKKRDRLFVIVLVIMAILMIFMGAPSQVKTLLVDFLGAQTGDSASAAWFDEYLIGSLLWFGLLATGQTYFQTVLHIQRQYEYIRELETQLNPEFGGVAFTREGGYYHSHSKWFSNWTKFIFWILFPAILLTFTAMWLKTLYVNMNPSPFYTALNTLMPVLLLVAMGLYLSGLFGEKGKKTAKKKKKDIKRK